MDGYTGYNRVKARRDNAPIELAYCWAHMLSVIDQGLEVLPKNKHLSENELLGAIGTLKSALNAIEVAKTGKIPVN